MTWLSPRPIYTVPPSQRWKPITQLFAEPYVVPEEEDREEREHLTQAEWWELLFFVRRLSEEEREHVVELLQEHLEEEVSPLQKCPQEVCTAKLRRGGGGQTSFRVLHWKSLECSKMQGLVGRQLQEVENGGRVCREIPFPTEGLPLTICSFSCYRLTFFP